MNRVILWLIVAWVMLATCWDIGLRVADFVRKQNMESEIVFNQKTAIAGDNVIQTKTSHKTKTMFDKFCINCSMYTNTEKLFRTDNGGAITCLNGIRFYSMIWIIWGHTYNYLVDLNYFPLLGKPLTVNANKKISYKNMDPLKLR